MNVLKAEGATSGGGAAEELRIAVYDARGQLVRPSRVVEGQRLGIGANSHGYSGAIFANPAPGEWRLQARTRAANRISIPVLPPSLPPVFLLYSLPPSCTPFPPRVLPVCAGFSLFRLLA